MHDKRIIYFFSLSLSLSLSLCSSRKNPSKKSGPSSSKKLKSGGTPGHSKGEGTVVFKSYDKSSGVSLRSSKVGGDLMQVKCTIYSTPSNSIIHYLAVYAHTMNMIVSLRIINTANFSCSAQDSNDSWSEESQDH